MKIFDVVIVGAGAAGLFCAGVAAQQGLQVLVLDHSEKVAEKIRISGGGRSNFTNREIDVRAPHKHFLGDNPQFCRSALSRYTPQDFVALMQKHSIPFHEKHKGQLFCDRSAEDLIQMLLAECNGGANGGNVTRWQPCSLKALRYSDAAPESQGYEIDTSQGTVHAAAVVVATGGLSIPKIGATDIGYRLAKQFNLRVVEPRPGLVLPVWPRMARPNRFWQACWSRRRQNARGAPCREWSQPGLRCPHHDHRGSFPGA